MSEYLVKNNVIGMSGVDTREITRLLRDKGSLNACMMCNKNLSSHDMAAELSKFPGLVGQDLAKLVSTKKIYDWNEGSIDLYDKRINKPRDELKVIAYDFGIKQNILRHINSSSGYDPSFGNLRYSEVGGKIAKSLVPSEIDKKEKSLSKREKEAFPKKKPVEKAKGGMATSRSRKPRGVGVALRGYGKALK